MTKPSTSLVDARTISSVLVIVLCLAFAVLSRHELYEKTPDYALGRVITSFDNGDDAGFFELVHDRKIARDLFDDLVKRQQGDAFAAILKLTGMPARSAFETDLHALLADGLNNSSEYDPDGTRANAASDILHSFGFSVPLKGWHYSSRGMSKEAAPGKAKITVYLYNDLIRSTIPCTILLEKSNASWHITGLADSIAFLTAVNKAYEKALDTYNEDTVRRMNRYVSIETVNSSLLKDPGDGKTFLRLQYAPVYPQGNGDIDDVLCRYTLRRNSDGALLYTADLHISIYKSSSPITSQFLLNPLIPSQQALIERGTLTDTAGALEILSLRLKNGTIVKRSERLPQ